MAKAKVARRGGRKKNEWTVVSLKQLLGYISAKELKQKTFAAHLGVTNSTFHNWKNGRCAPEEPVQVRIKALIDGKEKITVAKKKTKAQKKVSRSRAPRGASSSTLAALTGGGKKTAKTGKRAKRAKKIVPSKRRSRAGSTPSNGNGAGLTLDDWNELKVLGQFVRANPDRSAEEIWDVVNVLTTAAAILA